MEQLQSSWKAEKSRLLINQQKNEMLSAAKIAKLQKELDFVSSSAIDKESDSKHAASQKKVFFCPF